jgi:hypothetical protein
MRTDKELATELRKSGKSYKEISNLLSIPKSTLSVWFSTETWSRKLKERLEVVTQEQHTKRLVALNKVRGERLRLAYIDAQQQAVIEFKALKHNRLFIAGLMLYWGEGDKRTRHHVKLTNTDPVMVRLYIEFLLFTCDIPIELIRGQILLYPDLDRTLTEQFWIENTKLPASNFTKSTVIQGRHKTRRLGNGVCMINVSSTYLKAKLLIWLELFPKELIEKGYYESI